MEPEDVAAVEDGSSAEEDEVEPTNENLHTARFGDAMAGILGKRVRDEKVRSTSKDGLPSHRMAAITSRLRSIDHLAQKWPAITSRLQPAATNSAAESTKCPPGHRTPPPAIRGD